MKAYLASKLSSEHAQKFNIEIHKLCSDLGIELYVPQIVLPLGTENGHIEVLETNRKAVDKSDLGIIVFDNVGCGTAMEYERAFVMKKKIIGFRSKESVKSEYLGKMMEGVWESLPPNRKVTNLDELKKILQRLISSE